VSEVGGVPDSDAINRAEAAAGSLQHPWARLRLLGRLVLARARLGDRERAASSIKHLGTLKGFTSGDEAQRGTYIVNLVERLVTLGTGDLALQAAELEPGDARFWSGPQALGVLARAEAAAGQLDAAIGKASAFERGTFDYGVMSWHVVSGAARHGSEALIKAVSSIDLGGIPDRQRYDIALILRDHEHALRRLLEPIFERARSLVPELAALERQRAAAPVPPLRFPHDLEKALQESTLDAATLRAADLDSEARRLDLVLFAAFAAKQREPWVDDLLTIARSLIDFGGHDFRSFYEYAAATGIVLGRDAAMPLFRDAVGISLSVASRYTEFRSLEAQVRMLARVADCYLRSSIGPSRWFIEAVGDLDARTALGLGLLSLDGLPPRDREDILNDWRANLPRIDRLDHLRAMGRCIRAPGEHELGAAILCRIESLLNSFAVEADSLRDHVSPEALEGTARLDPAVALRDARAGMFGSPIEAVTSLAKFLAGRLGEPPAAAPFVEATRFAREHADSVFLPGHDVLRRLLALGETEEAVLLSKRLIGPGAVRRRSNALDVIKAFVTTGRSSDLLRAFEESGIEPGAEWLFQAARQAATETGSRALEPEELRSLNTWYCPVDICELGLAALDLGIPAGNQLVSSAIENAAVRTGHASGGDGVRSDALRHLVSLLCRRGAPADARKALSRMQRSGGDARDWTIAVGDLGGAYCEAGEVGAALRLIDGLNLHNTDERSAVSSVRRAAARALAGAGDLSAAEEQIALIPDARVRRAASAVVVHYYARRGEYRSALRHIAQSTMSQNIHLCVEVVNLLVEQKCIDTLEDYDAIVDAIAANESAAAPGAA